MVQLGVLLATAAGLVIAAACTEGAASGSRQPATPGVVDSALPIDEELRRFREGLVEPAGLRGGAPSREALVRSFVAALEARDTAGLQRLGLEADEFAWLYYPTSRFPRPPYQLPPDLVWFQMQGQSGRGVSLLLGERAGSPLGYLGHSCATERTEGENRIHGHCVLRRVTAAWDTVGERLFGLIVERGGVFKFVSYANKLD